MIFAFTAACVRCSSRRHVGLRKRRGRCTVAGHRHHEALLLVFADQTQLISGRACARKLSTGPRRRWRPRSAIVTGNHHVLIPSTQLREALLDTPLRISFRLTTPRIFGPTATTRGVAPARRPPRRWRQARGRCAPACARSRPRRPRLPCDKQTLQIHALSRVSALKGTVSAWAAAPRAAVRDVLWRGRRCSDLWSLVG